MKVEKLLHINNLKCIPPQNHTAADISRAAFMIPSVSDTECRNSPISLFIDREFQSDFLWDHDRPN
jgi:hypothetical protein